MVGNAGDIGRWNVNNAQVPKETPQALGAILNFQGGVTAALVDLTQNYMGGQISYVQGVFVDNSASLIALILIVNGTNQRVVIPAQSQGYFPLLSQNPPIFSFFGANNASPGALVPVLFYNVPLPAGVWGPSGFAGLTYSGNNLLVQDTAAETSLAALAALISGGGIGVNVLSGAGGGGGFEGPLEWRTASNGATLTTVLYTPAGGKRFYVNNLTISIDPLAFRSVAGGQSLSGNVSDENSGTRLLRVEVFVPQVAPAPTTALGNIILFSEADMGWLSNAINNRLIWNWDVAALSGGAVYFNFSVLTGDHV